jgi:hypothetical protein
MSILLPQRISEAPLGPDASSVDGSTLRPEVEPAAAEYIKLATSSSANAAMANAIAARVEIGFFVTSGGQIAVAGTGQRGDIVQPQSSLEQPDAASNQDGRRGQDEQALRVFDGDDGGRPDEHAEAGE